MSKHNVARKIKHYQNKIEDCSDDEGEDGRQTSEPVTEPVTPVSDEPFAALELLPEVESGASTVQELTSNPEMLQALDESICDSPKYGPKIHDTLANFLTPLVQKGMPKEDRDKLLKEYLTPKNCRLLQSLKVKSEMSAAIPDFIRKRVKRLEFGQQLLGAGIIAVNKALEVLLKDNNKIEAIRHLGNACYIGSGLHAILTQDHIKLIIPYLDENLLLAMQDTERDETLFGTDLSEKIEAVKASKATHSAAIRPSGNWNSPCSLPNVPRRQRRVEEASSAEPPPVSGPNEALACEQATRSDNQVTQRTSPPADEAYPGGHEALPQAFARRNSPS